MDKSLWNHIIQEILLLVLLVLSAFPVLKNKGVLYIVYIYMRKGKNDKKLVKKCNWTRAVRRVRVGEGCSERSKTYHKVFKEFGFLLNNIAQLSLNAAPARL